MFTPRPRRRSDGSIAWQVQFEYHDEDGVRRRSSETFDDFAPAERWAGLVDRIGVHEALKVLEVQRHDGSGVRLTDWLTRYTERLRGVSEPVRRKYHAYIRNDIAPFFGDTTVDAVTQDLDAAWIGYLEQDKGNSPKTIHNKHGFLSGGMRAATLERPEPLIIYNPCAGMRLPRHDAPELDIFDNDEWELFEQLLGQRWRALAEFGLVSMARPSEIFALLVEDIEPDTGAVRISKAWKDSGSRLTLGKPKTKRGVRTIHVPLATLERLDLDRPGDELLFHTVNDTPMTAGNFHKRGWQPALRRLDALARGDFEPFSKKALWRGASPEQLIAHYGKAIATLQRKHLTPYTLRHTGISWKLQDGVPIFVVSRDAGHESVTITDRRYGHNDRTASASAAQVIAARLPQARARMLTLVA
ncbi:tyrosine-type recombinase/integrase [Nocardia abscessus]|uniref:tyrosine-type recombinase/integrase n=1 Tax=Nocardia abscessus TaxID=120957 RepID=UPI00245386FF|nr:tyrosine-type recombinase/integrase [Nocardia abscessus]